MNHKHNLLESILAYAKKQNIVLDIESFSFRLVSHPSYPNLLSVIETLEYFQIPHAVYNVAFDEIDQTPDSFLAFLKTKHRTQDLHLVERKNGQIFIDSQKVPLEYLKIRWKNIVLLFEPVEKSKLYSKVSRTKKNLFALLLLSALSFILLQANVIKSIFSLLSIVGFIVSILSLKSLFQFTISNLDKFCKKTNQNNCDSVINSKKWKLFKYVNFSDISFLFFLSQIISYLLMNIASYEQDYFFIQKVVLLASMLFVITSLLYQKFAEKKWCPLCLVISSVLILQMTLLFYSSNNSITISLEPLLLYAFIQAILVFGWYILKDILKQVHKLKTSTIESTRIIRNYTLFKNTLIEQPKYDFSIFTISSSAITRSQLVITVITNPFCDFCKKAHSSLQKIVQRYGDQIAYNTILNVDILDEYDNDKLICQNMMAMQLQGDINEFNKALHTWFTNENESQWLASYSINFDKQKVDKTFIQQKQWCIKNQIDFTPGLFINGYFYPKIYAIDHLDYFIQDLLSDTEIIKNSYELSAS
ncbi:vitamin K epoxide reductase family protein [Aquimarina sp. W85]|uniref:vitamin K epoxide reductase family protein n=1 Tax=Aquimarina rhodophyticola TaxID=3342246 RepID=UPI00366C1681